ncbi:hypothetical protein L873DRAFT_1801103 [Choiromyces venosus 120613-1]|uniref:Extracellular membrane protein CFEM domain-containing protein n=1 Tax=Choiromyces venosus 120613-1 TaxID=1336337 RepID=A0A3N4K124_9PEZI|nr:hypothetical protein L873DRAFT_1801103 [Choiromyces venosus 120613-1]
MQFKPIVLMALLTAIASATVVPTAKIPCDSNWHPCNLYSKYEDCSPEYVKILKQCVDSGCIQWFMDPLAHCNKDTA